MALALTFSGYSPPRMQGRIIPSLREVYLRMGELTRGPTIRRYCCHMSSEKRKAARASSARKLQVTYVDEQGRDRFEIVSAQDISETGCRILLRFKCRPERLWPSA